MNKIAAVILRHPIQSWTIRNTQLSSFKAVANFATDGSTNKPISKNPRLKTSPRITLISPENSLEVVTLDQAKKIAERRQLKLVTILDFDTKTSRPVYKLMSGSDYHAEELKKRDEKKLARKEQHIKPEKLLTLSNKISEHDLRSKVLKCIKWVEKLHEIRVVISGDASETEKSEKVSSVIESEMATVSGRILQKRSKDGIIKFSIMPTIKKENVTPEKPAAAKKLLEVEIPQAQQARSHHTMAF